MYYDTSELPRDLKKSLILVFDLVCIISALTLAISLRMGELWPNEMLTLSQPLYPVMASLGVVISLALGVPSIRLSSFDADTIVKHGVAALIVAALCTVLNWSFGLGAPRTVPMIAGLLFFALSVGGKLVILRLLQWLGTYKLETISVAIYGAGSAGLQILAVLREKPEYRIAAIVDDNPALAGVIMGRLTVQSPEVLRRLVQTGRIGRILIAMPSISDSRRAAIVQEFQDLSCEIQVIPSYAEMLENGGLMQSLKPVSPNDLLGRGAVDLDVPEIDRAYAGRSVLITGAGGSIGSELSRQILRLKAHRLVLFEQSKFALYNIERELRALATDDSRTEILAVLGSVTDRARLDEVLASFEVDIVLHAAAYKHVPLVEENEVEGVRNNVFGTQIAAEAAAAAGVERFILVSTDKAVRPTNVMGATKRLAEMVIQDLQTRKTTTRFSMVRFGNVLDSSGSVVPLFREQIAAGGPVTLTDPEVTRYFMTMPEAARLVILAGAYATGGETFVLDMGKPVKIIDLARQMIELSGLRVRDADNLSGDIEIKTTGLRPGEKLYEELLIGEGMLETPHPKILRAEEDFPSQIEMAGSLRELRQAIERQSAQAVRRAITECVEGYRPVDEQAMNSL